MFDLKAAAVPQRILAPPRLHWVWVLVLGIVTGGVFWCVWLIVQSVWTRRVRDRGSALWFAIFYLAMKLSQTFLELTHYSLVPRDIIPLLADALETLERLGYLATISMLWIELQQRPISLGLSGLGAYFFGPVYIQYSLQEAAKRKVADAI